MPRPPRYFGLIGRYVYVICKLLHVAMLFDKCFDLVFISCVIACMCYYIFLHPLYCPSEATFVITFSSITLDSG
jgi:hypothetical protein